MPLPSIRIARFVTQSGRATSNISERVSSLPPEPAQDAQHQERRDPDGDRDPQAVRAAIAAGLTSARTTQTIPNVIDDAAFVKTWSSIVAAPKRCSPGRTRRTAPGGRGSPPSRR